jgi:anti-sigma factor RsiW
MTTFSGHLTDGQAQRLIDGLLDPVRDADVAEHAAACPDCAALVESYRLLGDALDGLALPEPPADFTASVLSRIEATEAASARERRVGFAVMAVVLVAAAGALAAAGAGGLAATVGGWADGLGEAAHAFRLGQGVLPGLLSALRVQLIIGAAAVAVPLLVGLSRLMPAPRAEIA